MVADARDHFGVGGLDQQRPNATHERRGVADHLPRHRVGSEQAGVGRVLEGVLERLRPVGEQRVGRAHHTIANIIDQRHGTFVPDVEDLHASDYELLRHAGCTFSPR